MIESLNDPALRACWTEILLDILGYCPTGGAFRYFYDGLRISVGDAGAGNYVVSVQVDDPDEPIMGGKGGGGGGVSPTAYSYDLWSIPCDDDVDEVLESPASGCRATDGASL